MPLGRPTDARFSESHACARLEGKILTLGVTDFAVDALGDIVFVDLPAVGTELSAGDTACEIESVKAVGEVYAPVSGTIVETNGDLADDPGPLGSDPFGGGWLVKIEVKDASGFESLLDLAAYEKHLADADAG
jgi:glycine cleavage system H protein